MTQPLFAPVSNIIEGPPPPRISIDTTSATSSIQGCSATKASAPSSPISLGVRDEDDQIVAEWCPRTEGAHRLQDGDHAGTVVTRAERYLAAVVVGRDQDGRSAGLRPGNPGKDVANRHGRGGCLQKGGGGLDGRCVAKGAEPVDQVVADAGVCGRTGGPRLGGDPYQVAHGPRRGEHRVGSVGRDGRGNGPIGTREPCREEEEEQGGRATCATPGGWGSRMGGCWCGAGRRYGAGRGTGPSCGRAGCGGPRSLGPARPLRFPLRRPGLSAWPRLPTPEPSAPLRFLRIGSGGILAAVWWRRASRRLPRGGARWPPWRRPRAFRRRRGIRTGSRRPRTGLFLPTGSRFLGDLPFEFFDLVFADSPARRKTESSAACLCSSSDWPFSPRSPKGIGSTGHLTADLTGTLHVEE